MLSCDLCVIGGGSGGLSVAAGASQMGAKTILVEHGLMGGECLNYGCVPSKALIAAAKRAESIRQAGQFGIDVGTPNIDWQRVYGHVQSVIDVIAPHDSIERFTHLGVHVIQDTAHFLNPSTVVAGDVVISARYFVIATGSRPAIPNIPGLNTVPFLTNENLFTPKTIKHLTIIGGGPIGIEMAQAHRRLGTKVTILENYSLLPRDDIELVNLLRNCLSKEDITIHEQITVNSIESKEDHILLQLNTGEQIKTSHILVATGRKPNTETLNLDAAGIEVGEKGIVTDEYLRTKNRRVFALGDVVGTHRFTHVAAYQAGIVLRNTLFGWPVKVDYRTLPWVTYTDPELAHIGLSEQQARKQYSKIRILKWSLQQNDRAQTERTPEGLLKAITKTNGRILGVSMLGVHAGEQILPWALAMTQKLNISAMAKVIAPYPTFSEASKRLAGSFFTPMLFSKRTQKFVRLLKKIGL